MSAALARTWDFYDEDEDLVEDDGLEAADEPTTTWEYEQYDEVEDDSQTNLASFPMPLHDPLQIAAPLNTQRFSYDLNKLAVQPTAQWEWFGDSGEKLETEAVYAYGFQEVPARPSWLEDGRTLAGSLARSKALMALLLVLAGWLVLSNGLNWLSKREAGQTTIYSFDGVGGVATLNSTGQANPNPAPPAASAPGSHAVEGQPSITAARIDQVLQKYNSPASGKGQAFYDLGQKYGIDPAYALAFFIHESSAGTQGIAVTTRSIGNIRYTADSGFENYNGFRKYPSWEASLEDWYKLISSLYIKGWNLRTVEAIVPRYAPTADHNSPPAYINQVNSLVEGWRKSQ